MLQKHCLVKPALGSSELGDRTLRGEEVARSVGISVCVTVRRERVPRDIRLLRERLGLVPPWHSQGKVLVRTIPPEIMSVRVRPMAFFCTDGWRDGCVPVLRLWMQRA